MRSRFDMRMSGCTRPVPSMVPPRSSILSMFSSSYNWTLRSSMRPIQPSSNPTTVEPYSELAVRTMARMTALRPGQSPPEVRVAIRMSPTIATAPLPRASGIGCRVRARFGVSLYDGAVAGSGARLNPATAANPMHRTAACSRSDWPNTAEPAPAARPTSMNAAVAAAPKTAPT